MTERAGGVVAQPRVLVVDDEAPMRRFLHAMLTSRGFRVVEATTCAEGFRELKTAQADVVLLDLGLPDEDGTLFIRRVREWARTPIIVLSARHHELDKVEALDAGADDYLTKPFSTDELLARMRVAFRHAAARRGEKASPSLAFGEVRIEFATQQVFSQGDEVALTPTEYRLLLVLARNAGRVVTHRQLLMEVWGRSRTAQTEYLRVYMRLLRQKLETDPARPRFLLSEQGVGYRLRTG